MEIKILRPEDAAVLVAVGPDVFDDAVDPRVTVAITFSSKTKPSSP